MGTTCIAASSMDAGRPAHAQTAQQTRFDIPRGPLSAALTQFGRQSGLQVTYLPAIAAGKTTPGLSGSMKPDIALARLLRGSNLTFAFVGTRTVTIAAPGAALPASGDESSSLLLDLIDITSRVANDPADSPYKTPSSAAHISAEQIEQFRGTSPGDILKGTPGVVAAGVHNGSKLDVNIRGMQGQNRVKVAIDGTQQTTTTWRGYRGVDERVYIDPDLIGGIDIDKGPSGSALGAGAPGGVVAIRTLLPEDILRDDKSFGMRLKLGTSDNAVAPPHAPTYDKRTNRASLFDFENGSASAAFAARWENVDVVLATARRKSGNYFAGKQGDSDDTQYTFKGRKYDLSFTKPGEEALNTSQDTTSFLGKAKFRFGDDHSLRLGYMYFDSQFGESMGSMLFQQENGFRQVKLSDIRTDTFTARYRWTPDDDLFDLTANVWAAHVSGTTRAVAAAPNFMEWGIYPADEPRETASWTYGADINNTSRFFPRFGDVRLNYGASFVREDYDGKEYCSRIFTRDTCVVMQPSIGTRDVASIFSSGEWQINDWLSVNGGLRYDAYRLTDDSPNAVAGEDSRDGGRLNPTIGVTLSPAEGYQFYARYSEGVRPPTQREMMSSDANAIGNPNLDPEVAKNWEFGFNMLKDRILTENDKIRLKLSYFHNDYDNYISRVASNAGPGEYMFTFANIDRAMFSGIELSGGYDLGFLFSNVALTYYTDYEFCQNSSCGDDTVQYDYAVGHIPADYTLTVTLGMRLLDEHLKIGSRVTHSGGRLAPLTQSDRQRTANWQPYTTVDAFASYDFTDNLKFDVQAENLFDQYYIDAMDGWVPAPGRTIRANLTARF